MTDTTKAPPDCDCLNDCGDDPAVRNGKAQPCKNHIERETRKAQVAKQMAIDPRWADIDFDKVNAEMRDLRDQVGRLQAHIDRTQPVQANAEGYVEPNTNKDARTLLESAAALCDAEVALRMKAARQHADDSPDRDRCYAAARAAGACADAIRAMTGAA